MPIPKVKKNENEKDFIGRCISTLTKAGDYDSQDQRIAVCYTEWRKKENVMKKEDQIIEIQEEVQIPGTDIILEKGDKIEILVEAGKEFPEFVAAIKSLRVLSKYYEDNGEKSKDTKIWKLRDKVSAINNE